MTTAPSDRLQKGGSIAALRQFVRKPGPAIERCEMCSLELGPEHQHLIDPEKRRLVCACDPCAILFTTQAGTKLRRVPRLSRLLSDFRMTEAQWNGLMIPIELAFFYFSSPISRVAAFYPSPAGATESLLELGTWNEIVADNPLLREMTPDVEALLVNRVGANRGVPPVHYIVPIDECYKLVGLIRLHWQGFSGGSEMWSEIDTFFGALNRRASVSGGAVNA